MTFTKGPWRLDYADLGLVLGADGVAIQTAGSNCLNDFGGEAHANARLIASAPELYEALKALVTETTRCDNPELYGVSSDDDTMVAARAALAKADGGK